MTTYASFYEGQHGEERLRRALRHQAMRDILFPSGSLLGDFYRSLDPLTGNPTQLAIHGELSRAVATAIGIGEDLVKASLVREMGTFVACAQLLQASGHRQSQLSIAFGEDPILDLVEAELRK